MARPNTCAKLRRDFIKLGVRAKSKGKPKTGQGAKQLLRIAKEGDRIEARALKANCAWADRIFGWEIE